LASPNNRIGGMIMQKTFFAPLRKVEDADDGSIIVTGIASTEDRDAHGEMILASAIKKALPAYKKYPAIREMHGLNAAGRAIEIDVDDDGVTTVVAHVVDPNAVRKVKSGTYAGFSVGGKVVKRDKDDKTIITEILLAEISLVDRPSNGAAAITMWKIDAGVPGNDDLAKLIGERDDLAKQLAARDRALADLADRTVRTMAKVSPLIDQNAEQRKIIASLTKQLAALQKPAAPVLNLKAEDIFAKVEADLASLADRTDDLKARLAKINGPALTAETHHKARDGVIAAIEAKYPAAARDTLQ
jgi:phage head maturation protease